MAVSVIIDAPMRSNAYGSATGSYQPPSPSPDSATSTNHAASPALHTHLHNHLPLHSAAELGNPTHHLSSTATATATTGLQSGLEMGIEEIKGREIGREKREAEIEGKDSYSKALPCRAPACGDFTLCDRQSSSPLGMLFVLLSEPLSAALLFASGAPHPSSTGGGSGSGSGSGDRRTASELSSTGTGTNHSSSSSSNVDSGLRLIQIMKRRLLVLTSAKKWVIKLLTAASLLLGAVERRDSASTATELRAIVLTFLRKHWDDFFGETGLTRKTASRSPSTAEKGSHDPAYRFPECDYSELREYAMAAWSECGGGAHPPSTHPLAPSPSPSPSSSLFSSPLPHPSASARARHALPDTHSSFQKPTLQVEEKGEGGGDGDGDIERARSKQSRRMLVVGLDLDLQQHLEGAGKRARQGRATLTGTGVDRLNRDTQSQQTDEDGSDKLLPVDGSEEEHDEDEVPPSGAAAGVNGGHDSAKIAALEDIGQPTDEIQNNECAAEDSVDSKVEVEVECGTKMGVGQGAELMVHVSEPACVNEESVMALQGIQGHKGNGEGKGDLVVDLTSPITTAALFDGLTPVSKLTPVRAAGAAPPLLTGSCTVWEAEGTGHGLSEGPVPLPLLALQMELQLPDLDLTSIPDLLTSPALAPAPAPDTLVTEVMQTCSPEDADAAPMLLLCLPVTTSSPPSPSLSSPQPQPHLHGVRDHGSNMELNDDASVSSKSLLPLPLPMDPPSQNPPRSQSAKDPPPRPSPFTPLTSSTRRDAVDTSNSDAGTSCTSPTLTASVDPAHRLSLSLPLSVPPRMPQERPQAEPFLYLLPSQKDLFSSRSRSQSGVMSSTQELMNSLEAASGSKKKKKREDVVMPLDVLSHGDAEAEAEAEESRIEEISSQLVFQPHRGSRSRSGSSSSSSIHEGGRRVIFSSQDNTPLSQEVEGYHVKRTLNGYIATADKVTSSLMSLLNCSDGDRGGDGDGGGEGRYGRESKRSRYSVPDSMEMIIGGGGGDRDRDPVMRCSSPLTLIREALEANHRVNGRLLELSRRYQEDLIL